MRKGKLRAIAQALGTTPETLTDLTAPLTVYRETPNDIRGPTPEQKVAGFDAVSALVRAISGGAIADEAEIRQKLAEAAEAVARVMRGRGA